MGADRAPDLYHFEGFARSSWPGANPQDVLVGVHAFVMRGASQMCRQGYPLSYLLGCEY